MNYHSDQWIMQNVREHYDEALEYFPKDRIICLVLQGSQNYRLDTIKSDIDTKLIVAPSFHALAMNGKPISTTYRRANDEHTDWKDIRLFIQTLKKQNLNFLETIFTPYKIINPIYAEQWNRLIEWNEEIAHYNPIYAVKSMWGLAHTKYNQLENNSPSHAIDIKQYGYSPKELHHLLRIEEYLERYINWEPYADCLISKIPELLKRVKTGEEYDLNAARIVAKKAINHIDLLHDNFMKDKWDVDEDINNLLDDVQYEIMKIAIKKEIGKK